MDSSLLVPEPKCCAVRSFNRQCRAGTVAPGRNASLSIDQALLSVAEVHSPGDLGHVVNMDGSQNQVVAILNIYMIAFVNAMSSEQEQTNMHADACHCKVPNSDRRSTSTLRQNELCLEGDSTA